MAMNYAWQERKKFAIPVATGVVVLLIWYSFILSPINKATDTAIKDRKSAEMILRSRMQMGVPTDDTVGRAERERASFQGALKEIQDKLAFRPDEAFRAREGTSLAGKFGQQRQAVYSKINPMLISKGMDQLPALLRFPQSVNERPEPVLAEWLTRLAVVQRVCLAAIDAGVQGITLLEVVPSDMQEEVSAPPDQFLGVLKVRFVVTGQAASIIKLCHALQLEGPNFLSLEAGETQAADASKNQLKATLTAGALIVRPDGALPAEAKQ